MKLLFVIAHPKHIYIFINVIKHFKQHGVDYKILAVNKDIVIDLLNRLNLDYLLIGENRRGFANKIFEMFSRGYNAYFRTKKYSPTVIIGQADPVFAIIGRLLKIPTIFLPDSEGAFLSRYIAFPLASVILLPMSYNRNVKQPHIRLNHYLELAYLHPAYFSPDTDVYKLLGLLPEEKFVLMRFVAWGAHHDVGHQGISYSNKILAINQFIKYAKVFISSETPLDQDLEKYRINIQPEIIHDVMSKASLFFGESATMATECAVLGTPAIYIDNNGTGYTHDIEEKFGLIFNFKETPEDQNRSIQKGIEILSYDNGLIDWELKRKRLLNSKINISSFLIWFISNYPQSHEVIKNDENYQYNFE